MRAIFLLPALLLLLPPDAGAALRLVGFGVKAGASYCSPDFQFEGAEVLDPDAVLSPAGAAYLEWSTGRRARFHVVTEAGWTRRGFALDDTDFFADYLSLPLVLRSDVRQERTGLYIFFGPVVDLLLGSDDEPLLDAYRAFALGGQAGMGIERRITRRTRVFFEFRFQSEFTNAISEDDLPEGSTLESVRHRNLQFLGGARF